MSINSFLFPQRASRTDASLFLLAMRLLLGILLMMHGYAKLAGFSSMAASFPDPLGIGSNYSLMLAIFGELFCPVAFIFGFLYRLSMLPMIATMGVAFFCVHDADVRAGELAFVYLVLFVLMYIAGPGRFSLDHLLFGSAKKGR